MRYIVIAFLFLSSSSHLMAQLNGEIKVQYNQNLEVLCTIENQLWTPFLDTDVSDWMLDNSRLMQANYEKFKKFKNHPAIHLADKLDDKIGTYIYLLGFYYENFPSIKRTIEIPKVILNAVNPNTDSALMEIDEFIEQVANFYRDVEFDTYYSENKSIYKMAVREVVNNLPDENFITLMQSYFGEKKDNYYIIVMPFFKSMFGMGWEVKDKDVINIYSVIAPFKPQVINKEGQLEEAGFDNKRAIFEWTVHEFSHSFFNPIIDKEPILTELREYQFLYKPIKNNPQYADWYGIFAEHLARAFEVRVASALGDKKRATELINEYKDWMYLNHFIDQLIIYENNRNKYKNFEQFMPVILKSLEELK